MTVCSVFGCSNRSKLRKKKIKNIQIDPGAIAENGQEEQSLQSSAASQSIVFPTHNFYSLCLKF